MSAPFRSIVPAVAVLIILASAAVAVALIAAPDDVEQFPADTPEGTVQRYMQALQDRDFDRAYEMLSDRARTSMSMEQFRISQGVQPDGESNRRIRVESVDIDGDRATVRLSIEQFRGTGLDFARDSYQRTVPVVMEDGEWKIDDAFIGISRSRGVHEAS